MQINTIKKFLKSQSWQFQNTEKNMIVFGINATNGKFQCIANLLETEKRFIFLSVCGTNTRFEKRAKMLELLNFINYKLFFGNFEMDNEDGEIRFRTSISYQNLGINQRFLGELIMSNIVTMDKILPAIMGLLFADISVKKATELAMIQE